MVGVYPSFKIFKKGLKVKPKIEENIEEYILFMFMSSTILKEFKLLPDYV